MSASAFAKVIYGFQFECEYLRVPGGTKRVCSKYQNHEITHNDSYCSKCGQQVKEVPNMVASKAVRDYAKALGITAEDALQQLIGYQSSSFTNYDKLRFMFGKKIVEANRWHSIVELNHSSHDFNEINEIFRGLGLRPEYAKFFLITEIHY